MISATITLNDGEKISRLFDSWDLLTEWLEARHKHVSAVEARQV